MDKSQWPVALMLGASENDPLSLGPDWHREHMTWSECVWIGLFVALAVTGAATWAYWLGHVVWTLGGYY
jgi:hypothetical protein